MEEITEFNQKHPFQFKIERIKDHIEYLIKLEGFEIAKERIITIKEKYIKALADEAIPENSRIYSHLDDYWEEESKMRSKGKTYEDGSTRKVIFELNELERWINSLKNPEKSNESQGSKTQQKIDKFNAVSKGIVLHYLMEYGPFPFSTDNKILTGYLEELGLPTSEWNGVKTGGLQAYKKGTLALPIDRPDRPDRPEKPGIISKQEFLDAIKFLKTKDLNAYESAEYDFNSYCREEMDPKEGNGPKFFRK